MDPLGYLWELFVVFLLIACNGILSLLEMALVSSRKSRLEQLAAEGDNRAAYVLQLAEEPTEFFSTVQIGITLVGIGTGVYSGAALAAPLAMVFEHIPGMLAYAKPVSYGLVVALVTYFSIILGELIPKRIAISNPEGLITLAAPLVKLLVKLCKPFTMLLSFSTKYILRLLKIRGQEEEPVSEDEVRLLIEQGAARGVFNTEEKNIIMSALELDDMRISEIMTPRTKISWLDVQDDVKVHLAQIQEKPYSCYVVADEDLDHVLGVIYTKRFLLQGLKGGYAIKEQLRQPLYVPENMSIDNLLKMFQKERIKVALAVDEFGSLAGMVTLRDVIEHLVGDVPSFDEDYKQEIVQRDDGSWLVDGMLPLSEFADYFDVEEALAISARKYANTTGGLVVALLSHIPKAGEKVALADLTLEVMDMDGSRVDKVLVSRNIQKTDV